jgi:hypothetical protein
VANGSCVAMYGCDVYFSPFYFFFQIGETASLSACQSACLSDSACNHFIWDSSTTVCTIATYTVPTYAANCSSNLNGNSYSCTAGKPCNSYVKMTIDEHETKRSLHERIASIAGCVTHASLKAAGSAADTVCAHDGSM